jgi:hypothetical protein
MLAIIAVAPPEVVAFKASLRGIVFGHFTT